MIPSSVPHGRTARRLDWVLLPPHLREAVEERCGSPVVDAVSQDAGFTPGFASVLTCADRSRHFVKAASVKAQRSVAEAYRLEAAHLAVLPDGVPVPRLQWVLDEDWVALGIEHVAARAPARPWTDADLATTLTALVTVAEQLTPVPPALSHLAAAPDEFGAWPALWDQVAETWPDLPHLDELGDLAARALEVCAGDTVAHTDVRDDNVLLADDGRTLLCDWNWPVRGAAWLDSVSALVGPRGDGLDVEAALARHPLTADVPTDDVDAYLALLLGYLQISGEHPVPPASPHLRAAQRWQAEVLSGWLAERRDWR